MCNSKKSEFIISYINFEFKAENGQKVKKCKKIAIFSC